MGAIGEARPLLARGWSVALAAPRSLLRRCSSHKFGSPLPSSPLAPLFSSPPTSFSSSSPHLACASILFSPPSIHQQHRTLATSTGADTGSIPERDVTANLAANPDSGPEQDGTTADSAADASSVPELAVTVDPAADAPSAPEQDVTADLAAYAPSAPERDETADPADNPDSVPGQDAPADLAVSPPSRQGADSVTAQEPPPDAAPAALSNDTPWYLQIEPLMSGTTPQPPPPLPPLPADAPAVLNPLLDYVYHDMGLDDIALLDLRALDTPPALGQNLIMLFGSARSERHLHVSSMRLVRWLRRTHSILASAAGLVYPSELRTKQRRLRKRARLVGGSAGGGVGYLGSASAGRDDGISTGWICINLGTLGENKREQVKLDEHGRMSGFGRTPTGTTIVVQAMTEVRRTEMDLEGLWKGNLDRNARFLARLEEEMPAVEETEESSARQPYEQTERRNRMALMARAPGRRPVPPRGLASPFPRGPRSRPKGRTRASGRQPPGDPSQPTERLGGLEDLARASSRQATPRDPALLPVRWIGSQQQSRNFGTRTPRPTFPGLFDAPSLDIRPVANGRMDLDEIAALVDDIQTRPTIPSQETCLRLLLGIFSYPDPSGACDGRRVSLAESLVRTMNDRGLQIISNGVLIPLIAAICRCVSPPPLLPSAAVQPAASRISRMQANLETLYREALLPCPTEDQLMHLMAAYADQRTWGLFWSTFRLPPRFALPRTATLYLFVFERIAAAKRQALCVEGVRAALPEMFREKPAVRLDHGLYEAIMTCIRIADPFAEADAADLIMSGGESEPGQYGESKGLDREKNAKREFVKVARDLMLLR